MPKNLFPLKWQKKVFSPKMAMVRISASFSPWDDGMG